MILYAELTKEALEAKRFHTLGWHPWKLYPKHHLMVHLREQQIASSGNPADFWCYLDENEIGDAVQMSKAVRREYVLTNLMQLYRL